MAGQRQRLRAIRHLEIIFALGNTRRGLTLARLSESVGASRATIYRDLEFLRDAGAPIDSKTVNGEKRFLLEGQKYPPITPTTRQVATLQVARVMFEPLRGTRMFDELDTLLASFSRRQSKPGPSSPIEVAPMPNTVWPERVRTIERAIQLGRQASFSYRSVDQDQTRTRIVEPLSIRLRDGHLYLGAHDLDASDFRTFKFARMDDVQVLDRTASPHPEYDVQELFAHAAKIWTGEAVHIIVRLSEHAARFANEWPLTTEQTLETQTDGSVLVHAYVSGTVEAMRWVLTWGGDAEALEPAELRASVQEQIARAMAHYQGDPRLTNDETT